MKRAMILSVLILMLGLIIPVSPVLASPGLTTADLSTGLTPTDLVQTLLGPGIEIKNVSYTGADQSAGTFSGGTGIIGFEEGIILSSGYIANVVGPNTQDNKSANLGLAGDSDLNGLIPGYTTYDATVLEFDFKPAGDTLMFEYVFGSEEYNEWVGSSFNDVFGFFLEGINVALLPGTTTPVAINNVNNSSNPSYYRDNDYGDFYPGPYPIDTELDGLTTVLSVNAGVTPDVWHHIKLAIADAGDHVYDSDVFIKAESFVSIPDLHLTPHEATNFVGEMHCLTANYTVDNEPVVGAEIHFEVISGQHVGNDHDTTTDEFGIAGWCYIGESTGTDEIRASVIDTIDSNIVTKIWVEEGEPEPTLEVGGDISPISKLSLLAPWIGLAAAAVVIAGITLVVRRRRIQG